MSRPLSDTSRDAELVLVRLAREMTPRRKLEIAASMSRTIRELALAGLRSRHPGASEAEMRRRLASLVLPQDLARAAYGADPDPRGEGS